jgi:hypothetical protein
VAFTSTQQATVACSPLRDPGDENATWVHRLRSTPTGEPLYDKLREFAEFICIGKTQLSPLDSVGAKKGLLTSETMRQGAIQADCRGLPSMVCGKVGDRVGTAKLRNFRNQITAVL